MYKKNQINVFFWVIWMVLCSHQGLKAQNNFHAFPIIQEDIYKITTTQAQQLGASGLDQIKILGYPGALPQTLTEESLELQEIPSQIIGDALFFYLTGPHTIKFGTESLDYHHHPYTDTLHYLIQVGPRTASVEDKSTEEPAEVGTSFLYQLQSHKEDAFNILNSGRKWFGNRMENGASTALTFPKKLPSSTHYYLKANLMAQSLSNSTMDIRLNGSNLESMIIPAIPNTTYGVKGREMTFEATGTGSPGQNSYTFELAYSSGHPNGIGFLDDLVLGEGIATSELIEGIYYNLENLPFSLELDEGKKIWDISEFYEVKDLQAWENMPVRANKIAVFDPNAVSAIQNLRTVSMALRNNTSATKLLIITAAGLKSQAQRLAQHKISLGTPVQVITPEEIYPAFGYGNRDVVAIRNFIAFIHQQDPGLDHVLFFGKGTYDYKGLSGGRPNLLPTYASRNSLNPLTTFSSDDFFGFVRFGEGEWEESNEGDHELSLGIGRLPVINLDEARTVVDKIIQYETQRTFEEGWNKRLLFFADDGDNNIHLNDAESHAAFLRRRHPEFIVDKLYLDAFEQEDSGSGQTSPAAKSAFTQFVEKGTLLINYIGHGNETTLTAEQVFTVSDIAEWPENDRLPLFVTATCEFGRHDSPFLRSGAEELLIVPQKGAIGVLTTGRPVFSSVNFTLNKAFVEALFEKENGEYLPLGEIFKRTKNNSLRGALNRNFSLLGDPSMKMPLPELNMETLEIKDLVLEIETDTLKALQQVMIKGAVKDPATDMTLNAYKGQYELTLFDKPGEARTLGNESNPTTYKVDNIQLFRGQGSIESGEFKAEVFIPQNIDYSFGDGTIRLVGTSEKHAYEAIGAKIITIGGTANSALKDTLGPEIRLFINDTTKSIQQVNSPHVTLILKFEDESGINVSGYNLGQDLTLQINDDSPINLNASYTALNNGYQNGIVIVNLRNLKEGPNQLSVQAWDNVGNGNQKTTEIIVEGSLTASITQHVVYPNPSTTFSTFKITHNRPGENLIVNLRVFSLTGSEIYNSSRRYANAKSEIGDLEWNYFHHKTKFPVKGTYIYQLELISESDGTFDQKSGKLIIQ